MEWIESLNPWWVLSISAFLIVLLVFYIMSLRIRIEYLKDVSRKETLKKYIGRLEKQNEDLVLKIAQKDIKENLVKEILPRLSNSEIDSISRACGIVRMKLEESPENSEKRNILVDWMNKLQKLIKEKAGLR